MALSVELIAVISLDGCITCHDQPGAASWASSADQSHFFELLSQFDVRVMGAQTYRVAREEILAKARQSPTISSGTKRIVMTRNPAQFASDEIPGVLQFTDNSASQICADLEDCHSKLALIGGGEIYNEFLRNDLVDKIHLTIEPLIFGSGARLGGESPLLAKFTLLEVTKIADSTLLCTYERS